MKPEQMERMHLEYRRTLVSRIARIRFAMTEYHQGKAIAGHTLQRELHTMAGSAGSFGFSELGIIAKQAELLVELMLDDLQHTNPGENYWHKLEAHITELEAKAGNETGPVASLPPASIEEIPLVIVCEDDISLAHLLSAQLSYSGYRVQTLGSPDELLNILSRITPHAILMDIAFPNGFDVGTQAAQRLRDRFGENAPPLCFITARSDFTSRLAAVRVGALGYFVKPLDIDVIIERLDSFTARRRPEPFRILITDDDKDTANYHAALLNAEGMHTCIANDPEQTMFALRDFHPDLILMDLYLPVCNGDELAQVIRQEDAYLDIPILFLSSETDPSRQLRSLMQGGDDFLTKPVAVNEFATRVRIRAERYRVLHHMSLRDRMTGLFNETAIREVLMRQVSQSERARNTLCLAMIDLDNFRHVNEQHGHTLGDQILKVFGNMLRAKARSGDYVGRMGGGRFIVLMPDTSTATAQHILERLRDEFASLWHDSESGAFQLTFSAGLASFPDASGEHALMRVASAALQEAKRNGRNCLRIGLSDLTHRAGLKEL